jgi:hypothetical protein
LTVKTHVSRMMTKLAVRGRAQLVVLAYESGLVVPGQVPDLKDRHVDVEPRSADARLSGST